MLCCTSRINLRESNCELYETFLHDRAKLSAKCFTSIKLSLSFSVFLSVSVSVSISLSLCLLPTNQVIKSTDGLTNWELEQPLRECDFVVRTLSLAAYVTIDSRYKFGSPVFQVTYKVSK